jgi:hypothetical protein
MKPLTNDSRFATIAILAIAAAIVLVLSVALGAFGACW